MNAMKGLAWVFRIKIGATLFWCLPLILLAPACLQAIGLPEQDTYLFIRLLGWAYLSLLIGYWAGYRAARQGKVAAGPVWTGIVSNGGACIFLIYHGLHGAWASWGGCFPALGWVSALATGLITVGLFVFGVKGSARRL